MGGGLMVAGGGMGEGLVGGRLRDGWRSWGMGGGSVGNGWG